MGDLKEDDKVEPQYQKLKASWKHYKRTNSKNALFRSVISANKSNFHISYRVN